MEAGNDGTLGWVTLQIGEEKNFELQNLYVCKASVALTENFDVGSGASVRKLEVGEVLELLQDPQMDEKTKLLRVQVRARSDGKEGWATMKGNQGTIFVEPSRTHFQCTNSVPLEDSLVGKKVFRELEKGEAFDVQSTKTERRKGVHLYRGRNLSQDGPGGWFVAAGSGLLPWTTSQVSSSQAPLYESSNGETVLRELRANEEIVALEVPSSVTSGDSTTLWQHVRCTSDGVIGFIQLRSLEEKAAAEKNQEVVTNTEE